MRELEAAGAVIVDSNVEAAELAAELAAQLAARPAPPSVRNTAMPP